MYILFFKLFRDSNFVFQVYFKYGYSSFIKPICRFGLESSSCFFTGRGRHFFYVLHKSHSVFKVPSQFTMHFRPVRQNIRSRGDQSFSGPFSRSFCHYRSWQYSRCGHSYPYGRPGRCFLDVGNRSRWYGD